MMDKILQPPVRVERGFAGTTLGGGNAKKGTYQIETLTASPMDSVCDSRAVATWKENRPFLGFGRTTTERTLEVQDNDAVKDLRIGLARNAEGRAELSVTNGQGARSTELRFLLGPADRVDASLADGVTAGRVTVRHEEGKAGQQTEILVGDQKFLVVDGALLRA